MAWKGLINFSRILSCQTNTFNVHKKVIYTAQLPNFIISRIYISNKQRDTLKDEHTLGSNDTMNEMNTICNIVDKKFQEKSFDVASESVDDAKTKSMRHMKYTLAFLGVTLTAIGMYILVVFGKPERSESGDVIEDEFSKHTLWRQYILRSFKQINSFALLIKEPSREKLLPDPLSYPYYQPPYTLVLEFTDVMAHPEWTYQTGWRFKKRPGIDYLLENLVGLYEIVIFTAEPGMTIFPVIEALDQKNLVSYKLVRDSTHFIDGHHVKNLSRLNRDLKKVIVIDWNKESVKFHPDNHLNIDRWTGNDDDNTMVDLTTFLKTIASTEIDDVREVLKFYKQFENPVAAFKQKQLEFLENQNQTSKKSSAMPSITNIFQQIL